MSKQLGVTRTVELIEGLAEALRHFSTREEEIEREFNAGVSKFRRRRDETIAESDARFAAQISQTEDTFRGQRELVESRHERWKARISRARKASTQRHLKEIEDEEGRRKYVLQKDTLEADRILKTDVENGKVAFESFTASLENERAAISALEDRARRSFIGFGKFRRWLSAPPEAVALDPSLDENKMLEELRSISTRIKSDLRRFRWSPLPLLFRMLPLWLLIPLIVLAYAAVAFALPHFGVVLLPKASADVLGAALVVTVTVLNFVGKHFSSPTAKRIASDLDRARRLRDGSAERAFARNESEIARATSEHAAQMEQLQAKWKQTLEEAIGMRQSWQKRIDEQTIRVSVRAQTNHRTMLDWADQQQSTAMQRLQSEANEHRRVAEGACATGELHLSQIRDSRMEKLADEWRHRTQPALEILDLARESAAKLFPEWTRLITAQWTPPESFAQSAKFGQLDVDLEKLARSMPRDPRLALTGPSRFTVPLLLTFPEEGSLLFETKDVEHKEVVGTLNNLVLRILSVAPPGRVSFTIIDPVELGQNFAGVMHLADFEERLINNRIWTQSSHIEEQLALLNEHIEKVTQMYLRNEYETIAEYNEQAGRIAEKYRFLVVADFPVNFTETAVRRLLSIAASGPRCGVYTFIHWDQRRAAPSELVPSELRKNSVCVHRKGDLYVLANQPAEGVGLSLDAPPDADLATEFLQKVGRSSVDSSRVEMPFGEIIPSESEIWTLDTTTELRVPIGRTGATKLQYLALGKGTRQHALIAGKTGSGKSTLFHVLVTNLSLWCSPEQVEFYLVDFKKGVEFKCYGANRLPHARVVAIESDREFALSVLQRVDEELRRRGDRFRDLSVQDVAGYKRAGGSEPLPRTLLLIDEFQEFFVEDDRIAQNAALLLDRIVRQGRAFGIHVVLGSQTLGGAYTLARTTLGQMVVRIALQCNEADAYLIMDDENPAPRLLSRPGEAIYNDAAGRIEGNSPFQIVWLSDDEREAYLAKIRERADQLAPSFSGPIVFEGNAPADVEENALLRDLLKANSIKPATSPRIWLGAPNSIKGPTEAVFHRQSGNNLLIVGQRDEAALTMIGVSMIALAAQHLPGDVRFILLDCSPPESRQRLFLESVTKIIPHEVHIAGVPEIGDLLSQLKTEIEGKADSLSAGDSSTTFLFVHGLQRFKPLRYDEDFGFSASEEKPSEAPGSIFNKLICEWTNLGIHVICTCDTFNNVQRFLSRKAVSEFEMRVLFQMSANDSAALIDSPKASQLGLHRALFHNEQLGYLETFRPYALPSGEWINQVGRDLSELIQGPSKFTKAAEG